MPEALPATTLPFYPGLGQAPNMLACVPSGVVHVPRQYNDGQTKSMELSKEPSVFMREQQLKWRARPLQKQRRPRLFAYITHDLQWSIFSTSLLLIYWWKCLRRLLRHDRRLVCTVTFGAKFACFDGANVIRQRAAVDIMNSFHSITLYIKPHSS